MSISESVTASEQWAGSAGPAGRRRCGDAPFPPGRAHLACVGPAAPEALGRSASTTTPSWARRYPVRLARAAWTELVTRPVMSRRGATFGRGARPFRSTSSGRSYSPPTTPATSTRPLCLSVLPEPWRHKIVTLAAADYFFDSRLKAAYFAFALNAVPIERVKVSRDSSDRAEALVADGWNLLDLPRGWPQPRRLGPGPPGWRGLARRPQRPPGRAGPHKRDGPAVAPRRQAYLHRARRR